MGYPLTSVTPPPKLDFGDSAEGELMTDELGKPVNPHPERPVQAGQKKELSTKKRERASLRAAFTRAADHPTATDLEFAFEAQREVVLAEGS